ncbi:hypothetical protein J4H86_04155 [Spiractinospora alimapuensis]|uniref:hypothetical protein n=1 Tax=Spiractinospora alimapuensis TaxID=2820884 RepID=UPI001F31D1D4|nr:hypothetical protein [Spiractinospora alimapuensis]QVQ53008.1 hypothetical protein J4H86_04155 [Spiractinospora alimapuensis]
MNERFRRFVTVAAPLVLAIVLVAHPRGESHHHTMMDNPLLWLGLHVALLPLFGLLTLSVMALTRGLAGAAAVASRAFAGIFVVSYTAMDAVAGVASGVLAVRAQDLAPNEQRLVAEQVNAFTTDFTAPLDGAGGPVTLITMAGGVSWGLAVVLAAVALRRGGHASTGAFILMLAGAPFFVHDAPIAPVALGALALGAALVHRRAIANSAQSAAEVDGARATPST